MILAFDTETTGLDPYFSTLPFLVTTCDDDGNQRWWEWAVDPFTRIPIVPEEDIYEIDDLIRSCDTFVLQNGKYDFQVMDNLIRKGLTGRLKSWNWDWSKIHDTMLSAHLISSCQSKSLTVQTLVHLGIDLQQYETAIKEAVQKARRIIKSKKFIEEHGTWFLASSKAEGMPSAGSEPWKGDMWVLLALIKHAPEYLPDWGDWKAGYFVTTKTRKRKIWVEASPFEEHPWWTTELEYAHPDSEATVLLFEKHQEILKKKNLLAIYEERRKLLRINYMMERDGVTLSRKRLDKQVKDYSEEAAVAEQRCINLAPEECELEALPANGASNALKNVIFDGFGLVSPTKSKKTGAPSLDKNALEFWLGSLPRSSKEGRFVKNLLDYRKRKTAVGYMKSYKNYWLPVRGSDEYYVLHPALNPVGTNTLRWSSSHPNEQNISKKEGFNLRYSFGPTEGRAWASLDYNNIELRIPAYESGEAVMIEIFEKPTEPPYWGSYHLMNASMIFPDEFWPIADIEHEFKTRYKSLYGKTKNFSFAMSYGAVLKQDGWGTADKAVGKRGVHKLVADKLKKHSQLNQKWIEMANLTGFVETIPDVEVDPKRGYPIECSRTGYGKISPTIPLNYHVQSTCMWVIFRAMIKIQAYLDKINEGCSEEDCWLMVMQVHDEVVLDFPKKGKWKFHLRNIAKIMESCGDHISIPLTVGCEVHENNWAEGYELSMAV